jgi:hypothetical protein
MKKVIYITYNVVYQLFCFGLLLFLGIYYNVKLIPDSLIWRENKPRADATGLIEAAAIQGILIIAEATVLILIIYTINRLIIGDTKSKERSSDLAKRTAKINVITTLCFIVLVLIGSLKH